MVAAIGGHSSGKTGGQCGAQIGATASAREGHVGGSSVERVSHGLVGCARVGSI